jgi:REP element-mobilizing transposase RayT
MRRGWVAGVEPALPAKPPGVSDDMNNLIRHRRSYNEPGHAHELTFTCFHRYRFLATERTCGWLAEAIEEARVDKDFALWAFVFMPEHAHLIVWPRQVVYEISDILKAIKIPLLAELSITWRLMLPNGCHGLLAVEVRKWSGYSGSRAGVMTATSTSPRH